MSAADELWMINQERRRQAAQAARERLAAVEGGSAPGVGARLVAAFRRARAGEPARTRVTPRPAGGTLSRP